MLWKIKIRRGLRLVEFKETRCGRFEKDKGIGEGDVVVLSFHLKNCDKRGSESSVRSGGILYQRVRTPTSAQSQQSRRCAPDILTMKISHFGNVAAGLPYDNV